MSLTKIPTVTMGGESVPAIGLGTWDMRGSTCRQAVESALDLGYRHIDTAAMYDNEEDIGRAIRASNVPREDLFIVTKVHRSLRPADVKRACEGSLSRLGVGVLDLYLIHWPNPSIPVEDTLAAFCELREAGKVRHVGVSNFDAALLRKSVDAAGCPVVCNQIEFHPFDHPRHTVEACREEGVAVVAYSPLAEGRVARNATLQAVGERHGKTAAQVALRWLLDHDGVAVIPKAGSREHQAQNLDLFDFELTPEDRLEIAELS